MLLAPKPKRGEKASQHLPFLFTDAQIVRRTASAGRPKEQTRLFYHSHKSFHSHFQAAKFVYLHCGFVFCVRRVAANF